MNKPNRNALAMFDAIKAEWLAAQREKRDPLSSNVIKIFRTKMKPPMGEPEVLALFDIVFGLYLEVSGHPTKWSEN